jgi:GEVED domain/Secretion system C-terminal sorting domain
MANFNFYSQSLTVNATNKNAEQLVNSLLLAANSNITITNVKFNNVAVSGTIANASNQIGAFIVNKPTPSTINPLGMDSGLILTTGGVSNAVGPNNAGSSSVSAIGFSYNADPDLASIATSSVNDAAVLEFDFVPLGNTINLKYRFASEEYNEYVCGNVNDAFGIFISGPGIVGKKNIALVPNTILPVAINTVNLGISGNSGQGATCISVCGTNAIWQQNKQYFQNNESSVISVPPANPALVSLLQYDGLTKLLSAQRTGLQCGQTFHLKIAIADISDGAFDSGILLEAGSFNANSCVCLPSFSSACNNDEIISVSINNIKNYSGVSCPISPYYTNFTAPLFTANPGDSTICVFEHDSTKNHLLNAWIDYNNDLTFADTERVITNLIMPTGTRYRTTKIVARPDSGLHVMRIIQNHLVIPNPNFNPQACGSSFNGGEAEDYRIRISDSVVTFSNVKRLNSDVFNLYPNPSMGVLHYQLPTHFSKGKIYVLDVLSRTILTSEISSSQFLQLSHLKSGTYTIVFEHEGQSIQKIFHINK